MLAAFARDERGGMAIFVLVLFVMLLVVGGMAVDYQRHEALRADLQDALDRGSLAAANLNQAYVLGGSQTTDEQARDVILDFMASRSHRYEGITLDTDVRNIGGGREVSAAASMQMPTIFLSLVGVDTLSVNARSTATHSASNLEIVLILDITGSMTRTSQSGLRKIDDLKIAAKEFLDTVLADPSTPTMVSIVPFSQNVNLPRRVADLYNIDRHHDFASCIDYHEFDFSTTGMPLDRGTPYLQAQHFRSNIGNNFGCPKTNNVATLYSNNVTDLKAAIDAMTPETWTAMYMGMKWGGAFLDPSSRPVVDALIADGDLDASFSGWPHAWNDNSVRKIFVLMSDGQNTRLNEIRDSIYPGQTPQWWNDNDPGSARYSVINNDSDGIGDLRLAEICNTVKTGSSNSIIYTIGFEVAGIPSAQAALLNCASNPTTYYLVEGVEISTAFRNIADEITNLKLLN